MYLITSGLCFTRLLLKDCHSKRDSLTAGLALNVQLPLRVRSSDLFLDSVCLTAFGHQLIGVNGTEHRNCIPIWAALWKSRINFLAMFSGICVRNSEPNKMMKMRRLSASQPLTDILVFSPRASYGVGLSLNDGAITIGRPAA